MLGKATAVLVSLATGIAPQVSGRLLALAFGKICAFTCSSVPGLQALGQCLRVFVVGVVLEGIVVLASSDIRGPAEVGMHAWSATHRLRFCRFAGPQAFSMALYGHTSQISLLSQRRGNGSLSRARSTSVDAFPAVDSVRRVRSRQRETLGVLSTRCRRMSGRKTARDRTRNRLLLCLEIQVSTGIRSRSGDE